MAAVNSPAIISRRLKNECIGPPLSAHAREKVKSQAEAQKLGSAPAARGTNRELRYAIRSAISDPWNMGHAILDGFTLSCIAGPCRHIAEINVIGEKTSVDWVRS